MFKPTSLHDNNILTIILPCNLQGPDIYSCLCHTFLFSSNKNHTDEYIQNHCSKKEVVYVLLLI